MVFRTGDGGNSVIVSLTETDMLTLFTAFLENRREHYGLED